MHLGRLVAKGKSEIKQNREGTRVKAELASYWSSGVGIFKGRCNTVSEDNRELKIGKSEGK